MDSPNETGTPISRRRYTAKDYRIMDNRVKVLSRKYARCVDLLDSNVRESEKLKAEKENFRLRLINLENEKDSSGVEWSAEIECSLGSILINLDKTREVDIKFDEILKKLDPGTETDIRDVTGVDTTTVTPDSPRSALLRGSRHY